MIRELVNALDPTLVEGEVSGTIADPFKPEFELAELHQGIELNTPKQKPPLIEKGGGDLRVLVEHRLDTPIQTAYTELMQAAVAFIRIRTRKQLTADDLESTKAGRKVLQLSAYLKRLEQIEQR